MVSVRKGRRAWDPSLAPTLVETARTHRDTVQTEQAYALRCLREKASRGCAAVNGRKSHEPKGVFENRRSDGP
jgi:hypothetical protein